MPAAQPGDSGNASLPRLRGSVWSLAMHGDVGGRRVWLCSGVSHSGWRERPRPDSIWELGRSVPARGRSCHLVPREEPVRQRFQRRIFSLGRQAPTQGCVWYSERRQVSRHTADVHSAAEMGLEEGGRREARRREGSAAQGGSCPLWQGRLSQ